MLTIEQCRGARGLLGWTQQDLADSSGLSKTAINNFEKGHSDIKAESLKSIRMAFESADIEFIGQSGIQKKSEHARMLSGTNALTNILEDIENAVKQGETEIRISNVDDTLAAQISPQKLFTYRETLKDHNIRERVLCTENTKNILSPNDECRSLLKTDAISRIPTFIYGSKVALQLWDQSLFVIIDSAAAAAAEKKRFDMLWAGAHEPSQNKQDTNKSSAAS